MLPFILFFPITAFGESSPSFDLAQAKAYFAEAQKLSDRDGNKLWGRPLYGPLIFIDGNTHSAIANQQDKQGRFHAKEGAFEGLVEGIDATNDDVEWAGTHWTMISWQTIPENPLDRESLFAHEMYHRIQDDLKLRAPDSVNLHLDSEEGRIWLLLEWRALAAALIAHGAAQNQALKDALTFGEHRHQLFPGSRETERNLEIAEGIAEYTGVAAASPDFVSAKWLSAAKLLNPDLRISFVRAFAYISGPAYGLLLDERLPGWRKKLSAQSDLGKLLLSTIKSPVNTSLARAAVYGESAIRVEESDRSDKIAAIKAQYRKLLVDGPKLVLLHTDDTKITFNPSNLISLGGDGVVYPTLKAIASWGTLEVEGGALLPTDRHQISVSSPTVTSGKHPEGKGWRLNLNEGWKLTPSATGGDFELRKTN